MQSGVFLLLLINLGTLYFVVIHPQGSQSLFELLPFKQISDFTGYFLDLLFFQTNFIKKSCEIAGFHKHHKPIVQFILYLSKSCGELQCNLSIMEQFETWQFSGKKDQISVFSSLLTSRVKLVKIILYDYNGAHTVYQIHEL